MPTTTRYLRALRRRRHPERADAGGRRGVRPPAARLRRDDAGPRDGQREHHPRGEQRAGCRLRHEQPAGDPGDDRGGALHRVPARGVHPDGHRRPRGGRDLRLPRGRPGRARSVHRQRRHESAPSCTGRTAARSISPALRRDRPQVDGRGRAAGDARRDRARHRDGDGWRPRRHGPYRDGRVGGRHRTRPPRADEPRHGHRAGDDDDRLRDVRRRHGRRDPRGHRRRDRTRHQLDAGNLRPSDPRRDDGLPADHAVQPRHERSSSATTATRRSGGASWGRTPGMRSPARTRWSSR